MNRRSLLRRQTQALEVTRRENRIEREARHFAVPAPEEMENRVMTLTNHDWTRFQFSHEIPGGKVYGNNRYTVTLREITNATRTAPPILWLSIHDHERSARHDWREFQRIKNELVGSECEAIEIYPPESRLVDTANEFHLWCLPEGLRFTDSIGFRTRLVSEGDGEETGHPALKNSRQRPFPPDARPTDLVAPQDIGAMVEEMLQAGPEGGSSADANA